MLNEDFQSRFFFFHSFTQRLNLIKAGYVFAHVLKFQVLEDERKTIFTEHSKKEF